MHALDWQGNALEGWFLSEKLDGWRCFWTGAEFYTRTGNRYAAPDWFKAGLPAIGLDGELVTAGRSSCDAVNSAVRSGAWHRFEFRPFDIPTPGMTFEDAQATIARLALPAHVRPVQWRRVADTEEAVAFMRTITANGGEGAMVRNLSAPYTPGRTADLLKMKPGNPFLS